MADTMMDLPEYDDDEIYEALPKQEYEITYTVAFKVVVAAVNLADAARIVKENEDAFPYPLAIDFHNGDVKEATVVRVNPTGEDEGTGRLRFTDKDWELV